jgi:hypothetical protein
VGNTSEVLTAMRLVSSLVVTDISGKHATFSFMVEEKMVLITEKED